MKTIIFYQLRDDVELRPVYGHGPWWRVLWFHILGWLSGYYHRVQNRLESGE